MRRAVALTCRSGGAATVLGAAMSLCACGPSAGDTAMRECRQLVSTNLGGGSEFEERSTRATELEDLTILRIDFEGVNTFNARVEGMALCVFSRDKGGAMRLRPEMSSVSVQGRNAVQPIPTNGG